MRRSCPDACPRQAGASSTRAASAELAGGAGVLLPRTRRRAGWWLIATCVAIFPANVHMALHPERFAVIPEPLLWLRLPLQAVLWRGPGGRRWS